MVEIITFDDMEIQKHTFHCYKSSTFLEDVNTEKVLVSNKISFGQKNFIDLYKYFINTLLITSMMIVKLKHYIKCFQKQACM